MSSFEVSPGDVLVILEIPPETFHQIRPYLDRFIATHELRSRVVMNSGRPNTADEIDTKEPTP